MQRRRKVYLFDFVEFNDGIFGNPDYSHKGGTGKAVKFLSVFAEDQPKSEFG